MDVTFLEFETFFHDPVSNSSLQGETRSKAQTWSTLEDGKFEVWMKMTSHSDNKASSLQLVSSMDKTTSRSDSNDWSF
ncbi:unnamed protein product [Prunus armeniaca]